MLIDRKIWRDSICASRSNLKISSASGWRLPPRRASCSRASRRKKSAAFISIRPQIPRFTATRAPHVCDARILSRGMAANRRLAWPSDWTEFFTGRTSFHVSSNNQTIGTVTIFPFSRYSNTDPAGAPSSLSRSRVKSSDSSKSASSISIPNDLTSPSFPTSEPPPETRPHSRSTSDLCKGSAYFRVRSLVSRASVTLANIKCGN